MERIDAAPLPMEAGGAYPVRRVLLAGLLTGCADGVFATIHALAMRHQFLPARIFQGIASGLLGPSAFSGGDATVALGVLLHFLIALTWTAFYALLVRHWAPLRAVVRSPHGVFKVAVAYGPFVWLFMYFIVIPLAGMKRGPVLTWSFALMLAGHALSVGAPIVAIVRDGERR